MVNNDYHTANSQYLEVVGTIFYEFKLPNYGPKSNQNVFFDSDASSSAEFEISEIEISRVDCIFDMNHENGPNVRFGRNLWNIGEFTFLK